MRERPTSIFRVLCIIGAAVVFASCTPPIQDTSNQVETEAAMGQYADYLQPMQEITMRDGITLRGDVYLPNGDSKSPTILIRTPYILDRYRISDQTRFLLDAGYVVVVQNLRGRFASEGDFVPGGHLLPTGIADAYDTIEWITQQDWSDGTVGMFGASYEASTQWAATTSFHPALKAIAPNVGGSGPFFEMATFGGPPYHAFLTYWTLFLGEDTLAKAEAKGVDVSEYRAKISQIVEPLIDTPGTDFSLEDYDPSIPETRAEVLEHLPLGDNQYFDFPGIRELYETSVLSFNPDFQSPELQGYTDFLMNSLRYETRADTLHWPYHLVSVPVMNISGWYDLSTWSQFKNLDGMSQKSPGASTAQYVFMGPWAHHGETHGDAPIGKESFSAPENISHVVAFFDKHLKGENVEVPKVRYYVMGANEWRTSDVWPPAGQERRKLFLSSDGTASEPNGGGRLTENALGDGQESYVYDPNDPTPTIGGRHIAMGGVVPGPFEFSAAAVRPDVLSFSTEPLTEDLEVTGEIKLFLNAASSAVDTDFIAHLVDIHPDGKAFAMADGGIRTRFRKSVFEPQLLVPGEPDLMEINLAVTSHVFKAGHRLRLDVSSSNFPAWNRNLNTGNPIGEDTEGLVATQTLFFGANGSFLDLPVVVPATQEN